MELVTPLENIRRGYRPARDQTHCKRGHPLSGDNLRISTTGARLCKACRREQQKIKRGPTAGPNYERTHCPKGHPYAGDNLYVNKAGSRQCKTCIRERALKRYYERKKWQSSDHD